MPEGNPLVAKAPTDGDGPGPLTAGNSEYGYGAGIGVAESAMDAFNGISNGDWIGGGLGVLSLAGEIASAAIDPFGYLMSSVASFLMEHMQPLKDMLDAVAGDPPVIQSYSETWGNVAKKLEDTQVEFSNAVKNGTSGWTGEAADAYRKQATEQAEAISGAATAAGAISTVVMIFGEVVAFVREFIRQLIADAVGKLISWVLETVFSLGFGTPVVVAQAVTAIAEWAARIADKLKALGDAMRRASPLLGKLADVFEKIIKVLGKIAGKVTGLDVINTRNIKPGGFVQRGGSGGGSGGPDGGGSGSGDGPDGDGSGSGSNGSDGDSSGSGDGDSGNSGRSGDSDSGGSGDSSGRSPDGSGGSGNGSDTPSSTSTRGGDGDGSPSTRDSGGSPSRSDGGSPNRAGDGDAPSTGDSDPGRTPDGSGSSPRSDGGSPSPTRSGDGGSPSAARTDSGSPSHTGDSGAPSRAPDGGSPSAARADTGGASPSHTPDGGSPSPTRTDTGGGSPSHTGDGGSSGGSPRTHGGDGGGSPAPGHHGGDSPTRPTDSGTTTSGSAPTATPRLGDPGTSHVPSQRGGTGGDGSPSGVPPQGQPVAGGMPPQGGAPGGTPGSPGSPGGRPQGGGWTGTPGSPGGRTPDTPGPRTPDTHTGPSRGPGQTGPDGRPHQPNQPQPVARGGDHGPGAQPHTGTPGTHGPGNRPPGGTGPGNTGPGGPGGRGPGGHSGPPHSPDGSRPGHGPDGNGPRQDPNSPHHQDGAPHDRGPDGEPDRPLTPDEVNQRHSEGTPAGSSYHRGDGDMGDLPHRVQPDPDGRYTVDVHVTPDGHARIGNRTYTPEEFADILRRNGDYDGRPIRLIGCDASSNDFARRLSRELDTEVMAPSKPAWTDSNGRVFSSDYEIGPDGRTRPRIPPNGEWDVHSPDGTARRASDDGFTPDTSHADKQDVDADSARDRGDGDGAEDSSGRDDSDPTDDPEYTPPPPARIIGPDDPAFNERFVSWDDPGPQPRHTYDPPIEAPHRDRDAVPDGNENPAALRPDPSPDPVPEPLRALARDGRLESHTAYPVVNANGTKTTFYTDGNGTVKWVEADSGAKSMKLPGKGDSSGFNPDLGYPLLPDVKYRVPNFHQPGSHFDLHTDHRGQTDSMTGDLHNKGQSADRRDDSSRDGAQRRAQMEGEAAYPKPNPDDPNSSNLTPQDIENSRIKWAGGHLVANEFGGFGEYLNMHPQMAASNSGNNKDGWIHAASWRAQEIELGQVSKHPHQDVHNYQVRMERGPDGVPSAVTMRWQEVTYQLGPDGKVLEDANGKIVESVVTKERVFPNREANYGADDRFKGR